MNISTISYRDLGKNVGNSFSNVTDYLYDNDMLTKVYPRGVINTEIPQSYIKTHTLIGRYPFSMLHYLSKYGFEFDHRTVSLLVSDYFCRNNISKDTADIHFYDTPGFFRSVHQSNRDGKKAVVRGAVADLEEIKEIINQEIQKYCGRIEQEPYLDRRISAYRRSLSDADQIIALSEYVKQSYIQAGYSASKISVVNNAVDTDMFPLKRNYQTGRFNVLYVGQLSFRKGIPYLFDAWDKLEISNENLVLCGSMKKNIEKYIESQPLENVEMPGWVDPIPHYHDASVFVIPSLAEGFAKVILEAMSTGTPVIVSENSGGADAITDGEDGFIVPIRDADAIADRIQYFRDRPREIERMGMNARETAKQYDWNNQIPKLVDHIT